MLIFFNIKEKRRIRDKKRAICFAESFFLYNFAGDKQENPTKLVGRGAWTVVQAEITPVEPDSDNADVGNIGASRMTLISVHLLI